MLLTERTAHLHDHAGQISFPGGRVEKDDADAIATALREAHEEIGLPPADVDVIGTLPEYLTATGYKVTAVIGLIERPFSPVLDAFEVSEVFEVPLAFLMDPINHERRIFQLGETGATAARFMRCRMRRRDRAADGRRYFIWGATAAILRNLYQFLRADVALRYTQGSRRRRAGDGFSLVQRSCRWLSLVITLLLEQVRPLPAANPVYGGVRQISAWAERNLNAGRWQHGVYAWLLVVVGLALDRRCGLFDCRYRSTGCSAWPSM